MEGNQISAELRSAISTIVAESLKEALGGDNKADANGGVLSKLFSPGLQTKQKQPDSVMGGMLHALCIAKNNPVVAHAYAVDRWGEKSDVAGALNPNKAALVTTTGSDGEDFVQTTVASEVIEALRPVSVVRASGAQVVQIPGNLQIPRTAGVSGGWVGEATASNAEVPATDNVTLSPKKAMAKVPISRELIMDGSPNAIQAVSDDVVAALAQVTDNAYIRGAGPDPVPVGVRNSVAGGQVVLSTGNTASAVEVDLTGALERVMGANVPVTSATGVWWMSSRSFNFLRRLRDANGNLIYPEMNQATPTLYGYRVFVTNGIPNNLTISGASPTGDESEIYFGRAPSVMIGDREILGLEVLENVAYTDNTATLVSGVDLDTTLVKAMLRTDVALRHTTSFAVVNGVQYGT